MQGICARTRVKNARIDVDLPMDGILVGLASVLYSQPQPTGLAAVLEHVLVHGGKAENHGTLVQHLLQDLLASTDMLMHALCQHIPVSEWVSTRSHQVYTEELRALVRMENGWHFSALQARADRIINFKLETMSMRAQTLAPTLWRFLTALTRANSRTGQGGGEGQGRDAEDEFLARVEGLEEENLLGRSPDDNQTELRRARKGTIERRRETVRNVVST